MNLRKYVALGMSLNTEVVSSAVHSFAPVYQTSASPSEGTYGYGYSDTMLMRQESQAYAMAMVWYGMGWNGIVGAARAVA